MKTLLQKSILSVITVTLLFTLFHSFFYIKKSCKECNVIQYCYEIDQHQDSDRCAKCSLHSFFHIPSIISETFQLHLSLTKETIFDSLTQIKLYKLPHKLNKPPIV